MEDKGNNQDEVSKETVLNSLNTNTPPEWSRRTVLGRISGYVVASAAFLNIFPTGTAKRGKPNADEVMTMVKNRQEVLSLLVSEGLVELDGSTPPSDKDIKQLVNENSASIELVNRDVDGKSLNYGTIRVPGEDGTLTIGFNRETDSVFVDTPAGVDDDSLRTVYANEYADEMTTTASDCPEPVGGCRLSDCNGCNNVWCTTCDCVTVFHQCGKAMYICDCCKAHPWCGGAGCSNPYPGNC